MLKNKPLVIFAIFFALALPNLYGNDCGGVSTDDFPTITAPTVDETIADSGLFTASVSFAITLSASSIVDMEIQTNSGATVVNVTSSFLPVGQSDFAGVNSVSADLDAVALGLVPGSQTLLVRLDADGVGGVAARAVTFNWNGAGSTSCEDAASAALSTCFLTVSDTTRQCYISTGSACATNDPALVAAANQLSASVTGACDDGTVQSLGYGTSLTAIALADRLNEECLGNASTLAARSFGGPHATVLAEFDGAAGEGCLDAAYSESASFLDAAYNIQRTCVLDEANCVASTVAADIDAVATQSAAAIDAACPFDFLELVVGTPASVAIARARNQSECMAGAAHGDTSPLTLTCAPGEIPGVVIVGTDPPGLTPLAPGVATQLRLDEAVWGTRCGDGSPYAFWVKLAPGGSSAGNIVSHLQGGGVCVLQSQCEGVAAGFPSLFSALDDDWSESGILSSDPMESAFADWTKLFMPYCTQDVFAGGGVLQDFGTLTVERYGAVNARAALRVLRNIVAGELNDSSPEGFRPDLLRVVFSGSSAGGFGVMFNLHHVLDEERWTHTTMVNDAALGLDSQTAFGIGTLGGLVQGPWATLLTQPPYCLATNCAVGPVLTAAHSQRLLGTPEQQLLLVSNQVDNTQINTTGWSDTASFVNEARTQYCVNEALPGVHYFLDAIPSSFHTYLRSNAAYYTFGIASVPLVDWIEQAVFDPNNLSNLAEEGSLTTAFPGVLPFGCLVN